MGDSVKVNSLFVDKSSTEWRNSVKNRIDMSIFHTAICFGAKANSSYGKPEIACADF